MGFKDFLEGFNAETVFAQLGGKNKLKGMIGAKDFMKDDKTKSVMFKFKGSKKANYVKITLNQNDLYDLDFKKIRGYNVKDALFVRDIQASDLKKTFENYTELYLSL